MESWFGGGILFAVAAVLWLAYLVPNWLQRREYLASERNAVRLQQTIRVLAETAEAPEALRIENAAKARITASKLEGQRALAEARASVDPRSAAATRLRRTRLGITIVGAVAAVMLGWQLLLAVTAGTAIAAISVTAALVAVAAGVALRGVNRTASERAARAAAESRALREAQERAEAQSLATSRRRPTRAARTAAPSREWTPTPLPQPLGQLRREAMIAAARAEALAQSAGIAEENARIAEVAERRRVAAESAAARPDVTERKAEELVAAARMASPAPSRFASMGIVDEGDVATLIDLDSAIARRRAS